MADIGRRAVFDQAPVGATSLLALNESYFSLTFWNTDYRSAVLKSMVGFVVQWR
jgi:hypothetical protein